MKKGISMMILVIAVAVMMILITSASVIGRNSIQTANFESFQSILNRIGNEVNAYYTTYGKLPIEGEDGIQIVAKETLGNEFYQSVVQYGDQENNLYILYIDQLEDPTLRFLGEKKDTFLVAENTHHIYSINGFSYRSKIYFHE